jgi:hypothetical protein
LTSKGDRSSGGPGGGIRWAAVLVVVDIPDDPPYLSFRPGRHRGGQGVLRLLAQRERRRHIRDHYYDPLWRRRRSGQLPGDHLWHALDGFLELQDAATEWRPSLSCPTNAREGDQVFGNRHGE